LGFIRLHFADGKNQEVKIISAEMPFTIDEVYFVSVIGGVSSAILCALTPLSCTPAKFAAPDAE
jgi:hypothetical protein